MKRFIFEEEHEMFRESFRTFLQKEVVPYRDEWRQAGMVPREVYRKAGEMGFLVPQAPEELGGLGLDDFRFQQIIAEEMGACGETGFISNLHTSIVAPFILANGSETLQQKYIPGSVTGELILGIAMTEPDAGSDVAGMRTTAVDQGDHYLLNGNKTYISNGICGDLFVVAARTNPDIPHAISLFAVEANFDGFIRGANLKKMGMKSQDTAELFFDNVKVPKENLIGVEGEGFKYLMAGLAKERLSCAMWNIGLAQYGLDLTVEFVKERKAFGKSVAQFQNTQFKLADLKARLDAITALCDQLSIAINQGHATSEDASSAKLLSSELLCDVADEGVQLHGGAGYMEEYPICHLYKDSRITRIFAGTSEIMKLIIARDMFKD
ncbi:acyl-CoA dehydrogenase family protein [Thalassotalea sp. LPB0316]|uniref:acyl-CoA dehydrogenase family protein n=1 Tax=Thalassotalea sp. LPB0316 TaxID=2769490 RepID=UPI001865E5ED|nr:acyl-CoA dehydrogenase family protein [Thalassotalea sp. LPB0316]QOL24589.1 acyl-CoA dehydrogenase family protein [Thalassotalea sp. LPB0316]